MFTALLDARDICKSFAGVRALKSVSFDLLPGEVHALVGENGAGKSTLIKIITGAVEPDSGTLNVRGQTIERLSPSAARSLGIAAIYQQPSLFPDLSVAENIALAVESGGFWERVDWKTRIRIAQDLIERTGANLDARRTADTLTMPEQQIVEIAKAIGADAKVVIMDEPTASLAEHEVESLFRVIDNLRAHGAGIIYISHRLEEITAIADRVSVLRDGEAVGTFTTGEIDRPRLIELMVGRPIEAVFPKRTVAIGDEALEVRRLCCRNAGVRDVSISVRRGEILGIAGLVGSGRTQLAETIFGLTPADSGEIQISGIAVRIDSPQAAIAHGIGYVPEDRRQHGVVLDMPIFANTSLANLARVSRGGWIRHRAERELAELYIGQLRVKTPSAYTNANALSGGNQQKVALARWLAIRPRVLILDEPTQGVDIGSKSEIHRLIVELAEQGVAIVMISSELPEILGMSDRIAVMREGRIAGILLREEASQQKILSLAIIQ
jgi:rhamnose transport system ATP-binding protein